MGWRGPTQIGVPGGLPCNGGEGILDEGVRDGGRFLQEDIRDRRGLEGMW